MLQAERLFEKYHTKATVNGMPCIVAGMDYEMMSKKQFQLAIEEALKEQRDACWLELVNDMECGISDWNIFKNTILNAKVSE